MTFKELFVQWLSNDPVLGPLVGTRIYDTYMPELTPDQLYPCLTYTVISWDHIKAMSGNTGVYKPLIQVIIWSQKSADLATVTSRIFQLEGQLVFGTPGGPSFSWLWIEEATDDAAPPEQMDERAVRYSTIPIRLWYRGNQ